MGLLPELLRRGVSGGGNGCRPLLRRARQRARCRRRATILRVAGSGDGAVGVWGVEAAALAAGPAFLGNWARGDGKTHIRVERCGAEFCGVNTWVRPGDSGEKVGDTLVVHVKPAGADRWSGSAFDRRRNRQLHDECSRRQSAHDHRGMHIGRHDVPEHDLDSARLEDLSSAQAKAAVFWRWFAGRYCQATNSSTPATTIVAIERR